MLDIAKRIEEEKQKKFKEIEKMATLDALGSAIKPSTALAEVLSTLSDKSVAPHIQGMTFGDLLELVDIAGKKTSKANGSRPRQPRTTLDKEQLAKLSEAFLANLRQSNEATNKEVEDWLDKEASSIVGVAVPYAYFKRKVVASLDGKKITKKTKLGPKGGTIYYPK